MSHTVSLHPAPQLTNKERQRLEAITRQLVASQAAGGGDDVLVVGAGLVGCFTAYVLARRGFNVTIVEKWPDMRTNLIPGGRSINLVLTHRGLCGLDKEGLHDEVRALCVAAKVRREKERVRVWVWVWMWVWVCQPK